MKLGIIGCGTIARQHALPMLKAGFNINSISGKPGVSESLKLFSSDFNVSNVFDDSRELLYSNTWDALLLTCPTEQMIDYLHLSIDINKPILVEKPISYNSADLLPFIEKDNICVGLNRRFYKSVVKARDFIKQNKNILIKVSIPETLNKPPYDEPVKNMQIKIPKRSYHNSIHVYDVLNFLAGKIEWKHNEKIFAKNKLKAIIAIGCSVNGYLVQLDNYYDSSANFSIDILSDEKRFLLEPIEISNLYSGMTVQEPSDNIPIRTYTPFLKRKTIENIDFKPGFLEQAIAFMNFCKNKEVDIAKIKDLYVSMKLIDDLS